MWQRGEANCSKYIRVCAHSREAARQQHPVLILHSEHLSRVTRHFQGLDCCLENQLALYIKDSLGCPGEAQGSVSHRQQGAHSHSYHLLAGWPYVSYIISLRLGFLAFNWW